MPGTVPVPGTPASNADREPTGESGQIKASRPANDPGPAGRVVPGNGPGPTGRVVPGNGPGPTGRIEPRGGGAGTGDGALEPANGPGWGNGIGPGTRPARGDRPGPGDGSGPGGLFAGRVDRLVGSVIDSSTSLLHRQTHDIVRFAMGSPAAEAVPSGVLAAIAAEELIRPDAYDYAATEGDPPLHDALLEMLRGTSDETTADRLTITAGGMQGLDLFCKIFVDPGDLVVVESPTYTNGSATALSYGAELLEVPVDVDGMIVDDLPKLLDGRRPKAIYTIPTFQNPSGATLSLERRHQLLELARSWGSMVIDDDPYGLLRFAGDPLPTLRELGAGDPLVFAVRTFSKIVAPGLRVGWVDTDPQLQPLLINAKQAMDTCTNLPAQRLLAGFLSGGHLEDHLVTQRLEYKRRKDAMHTALQQNFGDIARWTDPEGGFFLWVTLENGVNTGELFEIALAEGVAFIPGPAFSPAGRFTDALRLCFASTPPDRIHEGIARLRRATDKLMP